MAMSPHEEALFDLVVEEAIQGLNHRLSEMKKKHEGWKKKHRDGNDPEAEKRYRARSEQLSRRMSVIQAAYNTLKKHRNLT